MSGDKFARVLTGLAVLAVAVIAAIVSFSHIESLALAHGQPIVTARLLPLSVDGLIVASSLTLLTEARAHREAPRLARAGLVLGVVATVLANVAYGAGYGVTGAVISAWPAVSFIIATEILLTQVRRAGTTPARDAESEAVSAVPASVDAAVSVDAPVTGRVDTPVSTVPAAPADTVRTVATGRARGRASGRSARAPERVFAAEIERGELPSLRTVKARMCVGTDKARVILSDLQDAMSGQEVSADAA